jgi:hypothetical protein
MIQTSFPNNDAVFQHHNDPIHTAGTVQSWFEEHESEFQHLPRPAQSQDLNITEPVLETNVRNRFPPPKSLKQLEDVLQEEWYKIRPETVPNLYESVPWTAAVVRHHIDKETCTVSVMCFADHSGRAVYRRKLSSLARTL